MSYRSNRPSFRYEKKALGNGDLRTPVVFFSSQVKEGLDGRDVSYEKVYSSMAHVYHPSMKDMEISRGKSMVASLTIQIRDPLSAYLPDNRHFVEVKDSRFQGRKWGIVDIRPDFQNRDFLILVLGEVQNG